MVYGSSKSRRLRDSVKRFASVIGAKSVVQGKLSGEDDYVIYGRVEGDGDVKGTVVVQTEGRWTGNLTADNVIICGQVEGDVCARVKLEITASARVQGNLKGQSIAIAEGAMFEGEISMQMKQEVTYFEDRRQESETVK